MKVESSIATETDSRFLFRKNIGHWIVLGFAILQCLLFHAYIEREVAWSPFLNGDANSYLGHSYLFFDSLIHGQGIPIEFRMGPHGIGLLLGSALMHLIWGASRFAALFPSLLFYIMFQVITYFAVLKITDSQRIALTVFGLLLCLLIPFQVNPNLILNITEYQREFPVFALFGIMIWCAILSNGFKNFKYSLLTGLFAGIAVVYRYVTLFHVIGIFGSFGLYLSVFIIWKLLKKPKDWKLYFAQIKGFISAAVVFSSIAIYPLYLARIALFGHYFDGKISGQKDNDFIALYQQGVNTFYEQVIYYPSVIMNHNIGKIFFLIITGVIFYLMIFFILALIHRITKYTNTNTDKCQIDRKHAYLICLISIFIPLILLIFYPTRSAQMGQVIIPPVLIILFLLIIDLYNYGLRNFNVSIEYVNTVCLAFVVISASLIFQIKGYSMVSISTVAKAQYLEVARLYDDIGRIAKQLKTNAPTVSADFLENYTLGCGEAIVSYHYEKEREILRPKCFFPSDVGATYNYELAHDSVFNSKLLIFSLDETPLDNWKQFERDPLSAGLADYPFSRSIASFRERLHKEAKEDYKLIETYQIFNRKVGLFLRSYTPRPISVHATSTGSGGVSASGLFSIDDSEDWNPNNVWHSEPQPKYPILIEFDYEKPEKIVDLTILPQIGDKHRAPLSIALEGRTKEGTWESLLNINKMNADDAGTPTGFHLTNEIAYKNYRLIIYSNHGCKDLVTLRKIIPRFMAMK